MTYNTLADYLADRHRQELYRRIPRAFLEWSYRCELIIAEILFHQPDVVCLQEVDHMEDFQRGLEPHGYKGYYTKRTNDRQDGCAIFWQASKLELAAASGMEFQDHDLRDNVAQIAQFRCTLPPAAGCDGGAPQPPQEFDILVANTHLLFNPKRGDIKVAQLRLIMDQLRARMDSTASPTVAVLVGDLNCEPGSAIYRYLSTGRLDCGSTDRRYLSAGYHYMRSNQGLLANGWGDEHITVATGRAWIGDGDGSGEMDGDDAMGELQIGSVVQHGMQLISCHASAAGREPEVTTLHDQAQTTVDYIWMTPRSKLCPDLRGDIAVPLHNQTYRMATARVVAALLPPPVALLRYGC